MPDWGAIDGCSLSQQHGEPNSSSSSSDGRRSQCVDAEDDGMEVDAEAEPKEEVEPFEDDHGDDVSDIDNDHPEE